MGILKTLDRALARVEGWLIILFLATMLVFTFLQVLLRGLFAYGGLSWANSLMGELDWSEPLVRLTVVWITFLGASLVTSEARHIKIDVLSGLISRRWLPLRDLTLCAACSVVCALLLRASLEYVRMEMGSGAALFLGIPVWVTQIILPAGFCLLLLRFVARGIGEMLKLLRGGA